MYNILKTDFDDIDGDATDKATYSNAFYCIYDGTHWSEYENIAQESVQFLHDGTT